MENPFPNRAQPLLNAGRVTGRRLHLRQELRAHYAYSIPTAEAIQRLVSLGPLVEIGAGLGYWAHLIDQMGGDIICYDKQRSTENQYTTDRSAYFPVKEGKETAAAMHPERALVLMWPSDYNQDRGWSDRALETHIEAGGDAFALVGEGKGGASGSTRLFDLAEKTYGRPDVIGLPRFEGLHDALFVYQSGQPG